MSGTTCLLALSSALCRYGFYYHSACIEGQKRRSPQQRPFVLSRSFFVGSQRLSAIWTGDNAANWAHLAAVVPMMLGLSLGGIPFTGSDVPGFFHDPSEVSTFPRLNDRSWRFAGISSEPGCLSSVHTLISTPSDANPGPSLRPRSLCFARPFSTATPGCPTSTPPPGRPTAPARLWSDRFCGVSPTIRRLAARKLPSSSATRFSSRPSLKKTPVP